MFDSFESSGCLPFLGFELCEVPIWWRFFYFADFVTCANFSNLCGKLLKTDTNTMFPLKDAQVPGIHFCRKKISKKNSASWFFLKRSFEKTLFLTVFYVWSPISQNQDQIQGPWFRVIYTSFIGYSFAQKKRQNFFSDLVFWAKKGMKKTVENLFLICSSYFSKLTKDTKTILPQDKQQGCKLGFVPTKFPSSRMTRSFFC